MITTQFTPSVHDIAFEWCQLFRNHRFQTNHSIELFRSDKFYHALQVQITHYCEKSLAENNSSFEFDCARSAFLALFDASLLDSTVFFD